MPDTIEAPAKPEAAAIETLTHGAVAAALAEEAAPAGAASPAPTAAKSARRGSATSLLAVTTISFSLTFVTVSVALLAGVLPPSFADIRPPVDLGVVLLIVPLLALVLVMMAEALRAAMTSTPRAPVRRAMVALNTWRPGHGEG